MLKLKPRLGKDISSWLLGKKFSMLILPDRKILVGWFGVGVFFCLFVGGLFVCLFYLRGLECMSMLSEAEVLRGNFGWEM